MSKNERADMKCPSNSRVDFLFFSLIQARLKLMACWRIKKKKKKIKKERERGRENIGGKRLSNIPFVAETNIRSMYVRQ